MNRFALDARERKAARLADVIEQALPGVTITALRSAPAEVWTRAIAAVNALHGCKSSPPSAAARKRTLQIIGYRRRLAAQERRARL